jgi:starch synthase
MNGKAAILFAPSGADAGSDRLMGMQVANAGFLTAYLDHAAPGPAHIHAADQSAFDHFNQTFTTDRQIVPIPYPELRRVAEPGCLHLPGPAMAERAWQRRSIGETAFSITGVTHAMASRRALGAVRDMLTAPMRPWDALICASTSIRDLVERTIAAHAEALGDILGARPVFRPHLPVIPLGIDVPSFANPAQTEDRARFRVANDIAEDAFTVLYLGRLSYHSKAHPSPGYVALQELASRLERPVVLIQAGWFYNEQVTHSYEQAATTLAPNVKVLTVDARDGEVKRQALAAADVFLSLTDNPQESFGLTPLEAMAAGLPCVISDWDGYRDTVVDGETGALIRTLTPPAGSGEDLAWRLATGVDNDEIHAGLIAQHVAIDVSGCLEALTAMAQDAELCRRLGAAGANRVARFFDWPVIIRAHEELWAELAVQRGVADPVAAKRASVHPDPFEIFAGFASHTMADGVRLHAIGNAGELFERHAATNIAAIDPRLIADGRELLAQVIRLDRLTISGPITPEVAKQRGREFRTLAWLAKLGVLRME